MAKANKVINKSGKTQPRPSSGGSDRNPGQGSGSIPTVKGNNTPVIRKAGKTQK